MKVIASVIDKYFDFIEEIGGNIYIEEMIPELLIDKNKAPRFESTSYWNAIESTNSEEDLMRLEGYYKKGCQNHIGSS